MNPEEQKTWNWFEPSPELPFAQGSTLTVEDAERLREFIIHRVMKEAGNCSREVAMAALIQNKGDVMDAVFDILLS